MLSVPREPELASVPDRGETAMNGFSNYAVRPESNELIESKDLMGRVMLGAGDQELDDLVFSWQRLTEPKLRKIALEVIRSMAA